MNISREQFIFRLLLALVLLFAIYGLVVCFNRIAEEGRVQQYIESGHSQIPDPDDSTQSR